MRYNRYLDELPGLSTFRESGAELVWGEFCGHLGVGCDDTLLDGWEAGGWRRCAP